MREVEHGNKDQEAPDVGHAHRRRFRAEAATTPARGSLPPSTGVSKPKRGRKRTLTVKKRLATVADEIKDASGLNRLSLLQERRRGGRTALRCVGAF